MRSISPASSTAKSKSDSGSGQESLKRADKTATGDEAQAESPRGGDESEKRENMMEGNRKKEFSHPLRNLPSRFLLSLPYPWGKIHAGHGEGKQREEKKEGESCLFVLPGGEENGNSLPSSFFRFRSFRFRFSHSSVFICILSSFLSRSSSAGELQFTGSHTLNHSIHPK